MSSVLSSVCLTGCESAVALLFKKSVAASSLGEAYRVSAFVQDRAGLHGGAAIVSGKHEHWLVPCFDWGYYRDAQYTGGPYTPVYPDGESENHARSVAVSI